MYNINYATITVVVIGLLLLLSLQPLYAETFTWTDSEGTTHFSDDFSSVPKKYRKTAKVAQQQVDNSFTATSDIYGLWVNGQSELFRGLAFQLKADGTGKIYTTIGVGTFTWERSGDTIEMTELPPQTYPHQPTAAEKKHAKMLRARYDSRTDTMELLDMKKSNEARTLRRRKPGRETEDAP
jgi:hypothetical protein